jgi:hypothetical protein
MKKLLERDDIKLAINGKSRVGIDVSCFDLDEDFSLDGFDVRVVNVMYPDCMVRVSVGNSNFINIIDFPKWVGQALWISRLQGEEGSIEELKKVVKANVLLVSQESVYTGLKTEEMPLR